MTDNINTWLLRVYQVNAIMIGIALLLYSLYLFGYYSSLPMPFGEKFFYCVTLDRVIGVLIFFLKLSLSFDPFISSHYRDGAFQVESNIEVLWLFIAAIPAVWGTFFLMPMIIKTPFVYQLISMVMVLTLVIWVLKFLELHFKIRVPDKEKQMKRFLCGFNKPLSAHEVETLRDLGFRVTNKVMGFGIYGTSYLCGYHRKSANDLVLKVIDITEWITNRCPDLQWEQDRLEMADKMRGNYFRVIGKLRAMNEQNIVKMLKVHNEMGTFRRIYIITQLAAMNLDHFLAVYKPSGVPEHWARLWFTQLCKGVYYLHSIFESEPFPHSNIKPENILLYRKDPEFKITQKKSFGRNQTPEEEVEEKMRDMRDQYILKLADTGLSSFIPSHGKVVTKRNPPIVISPPKIVVGKRFLRILSEKERGNEEKKFDDIYQMGVILLLLLKGDITKLIKGPKDTNHIRDYVTGVDALYVRFDRPEIIQKLIGKNRADLYLLLRKMMYWEPLLRYDINQVLYSEWMNTGTNGPQNED